MSDDASIAVAVETPSAVEGPPKPKQRRKKQLANTRPKKQPPYAVVLFNDDQHTFQYVIETLTKVFGYPQEKSYSLALQIHNAGKGIVWSGSREVAELKRDQIRSAGPDFYATKKVEFPLGVTVEPLPG
jgi:ATP-dependent Clp protease adaptor protein ClpS